MWVLVLSACKQTPACAAKGTGPHPYRLGNAAPLFYRIYNNDTEYPERHAVSGDVLRRHLRQKPRHAVHANRTRLPRSLTVAAAGLQCRHGLRPYDRHRRAVRPPSNRIGRRALAS